MNAKLKCLVHSIVFAVAFVFVLSISKSSAFAATYTCECNGVKYESLNAAIKSNEGTLKIKMLRDESYDSTYVVNEKRKVTLDLAGHKITDTRTGDRGEFFYVEGSLTINDSVGTGVITSGEDYYGIITVREEGCLTINGGTIKENDTPDLNQYGIYCTSGTIVINGGTIKAIFPFYLTGKFGHTDVTINGGNFIAERNSVLIYNVTATINGGYFEANGKDEDYRGLYIFNLETDDPATVTRVTLNGGEFHGKKYGLAFSSTDEAYPASPDSLVDDDHYLSDTKNYQDRPHEFWSAPDLYVKKKPAAKASDFKCVLPSKLIYDGQEKAATVTAKSKGLGAFTVYYVNASTKATLPAAPSAIGKYQVWVELESGASFCKGKVKLAEFSITAPGAKTFTKGNATYKITKASKGKYEVALVSLNKKAKTFTVPSTVKFNSKNYKVVAISAKAFSKATKLKTLTIKSKYLTKKTVKNSLKGSKITKIKTTKALLKKYKKIFTKKNCGKKVKVTK